MLLASLVGVAGLSIHTDLPSRVGQRVGYVEGLYVVPLRAAPWCRAVPADRFTRVGA